MIAASMLETLAGLGMGALGLAGGAALFRRRLSRDQIEIKKDQAEGDFVGRLLTERDEAIDEARDARADQHASAETIARLTAQNEHQAAEIKRIQREFSSFKRMLMRNYPDVHKFLSTDFAPLASDHRLTP